jgi:hypothetical protein
MWPCFLLSIVLFSTSGATLDGFVADADGPVILPWLESRPASAPAKLAVIIPAFGPPDAYIALAKQMQASASSRLIVGIVKCNSKLPGLQYICDAEYEIFKVIPDVIASANQACGGLLKPSDIFIGGHAVGGAEARRFVDKGYGDAAGVFTFGTQYNGDNDLMVGYLGYPEDLVAYPRPFLGLSGELDKMPISHLALMVRRWKALSGDDRLKKYPAILPGLDESSYMSSPYISDKDLAPEVSRDVAQRKAGKIIAAWIDFVSDSSKEVASQALEDALETTQMIAQPFMDAIDIDASWCTESQRKVPGVPDSSSITVRHVPQLKLDSCHTSYAVNSSGKLQLNLCDYSAYTYGHRPPWNPTYAGAQDISCKMIAQDRVAQLLELPAPDMSDPAVKNFCQTINEAAFDKAKALVEKSWPRAVDRFSSQGKTMKFHNDTQTSAGPLWLFEGLKFQELQKEIHISGVALISSIKSLIYPGNHYCKLLSPSVAVEIIMSMGLTHHVSSQDDVSNFKNILV